jgi:hypothetical protein
MVNVTSLMVMSGLNKQRLNRCRLYETAYENHVLGLWLQFPHTVGANMVVFSMSEVAETNVSVCRLLVVCCTGLGFWCSMYMQIDDDVSEKHSVVIFRVEVTRQRNRGVL